VFLQVLRDSNSFSIESGDLLSLLIFIKNKIKIKITNKSITQEDALEVIKVCIDLTLTKNYSKENLQNLALSLKDLFDYSLITQNKEIVEKIVDLLYNYILSNDSVTYFTQTILIIENIILSSSITKDNSDVIIKIFQCSMIMFDKTIDSLAPKNNLLNNDPNSFLICIENLQILFHFLYLSLLKVKTRLNMLDNFIKMYNEIFIPISIRLLNLNFNLNDTHLECDSSFKIMWTGKVTFDNSINTMKSKCLIFLNYYIEIHKASDFTVDILQHFSKLIEPFNIALLDVINTKYNLLSQFDQVINHNHVQENNYQKLMYEILIFLANFLSKKVVVNEFNSYINK